MAGGMNFLDKIVILIGIGSVVYFIGLLCIINFVPIIFKYGITFISYNIGKTDKLDFSDKIGNIYKKKYTKIKIISQDEMLFIPDSQYAGEFRILPFFINRCIFYNGKYIIISQIPLTYLIFPLLIFATYYIEKDIDNIKIVALSLFTIFVIQLIINNWKMKFMINDLKEFISGVE
jgi:hypothetical protein